MPSDQRYLDFAAAHPRVGMAVPLAGLSSFGVGGPADLYYRLEKTEDLEPLIKTAWRLEIPVFVLGGGTNTVFADEGFRGLVIHIMARKVQIEPSPTDEVAGEESSSSPSHRILSAEAGALLSQVVAFTLKNNLAGLEKLMGLPGTIGGAVRGNAGAHGVEIADAFLKALIYSPKKGLYEAGRAHLNFSYRHSQVKDSGDIILKVWLSLEEKDCTEAVKKGTEIVTKRITAQPKGRSTGSFFKNPGIPARMQGSVARMPTSTAPGSAQKGGALKPVPATSDPSTPKESKAGYLLEQSGCKGLQVGGARVSDEHANWIMNEGDATQKDLLELARLMRKKVRERFDITLEPEVQLVGEAGPIRL